MYSLATASTGLELGGLMAAPFSGPVRVVLHWDGGTEKVCTGTFGDGFAAGSLPACMVLSPPAAGLPLGGSGKCLRVLSALWPVVSCA